MLTGDAVYFLIQLKEEEDEYEDKVEIVEKPGAVKVRCSFGVYLDVVHAVGERGVGRESYSVMRLWV